MTTLIYDSKISGHHLEYLHHYHQGTVQRKDEKYIFCLEEGFEKEKDKYDWPESENVQFSLMNGDDLHHLWNSKGFSRRLAEAKMIVKKAKQFNADRILLTDFATSIAFLIMLLPKSIKVRGIIYKIFLYEKSHVSKLRYLVNRFLYFLIAKSSCVDSVFILNDERSANTLNTMYNVGKFKFLPDPVPSVDMNQVKDIREEYGISAENRMFLHFGGLSERKGTLEILKAIDMMSENQLRNQTYVFAGRVYNDIRERFYQLVKKVEQKCQIIVFDEFCSFQLLYNLCHSCDTILMPYYLTNLSSGVLGYAAVFGKPVIGPSGGLIGHLISKHKMGMCLKQISAETLSHALTGSVECQSHEYASTNTVDAFVHAVLS